MNHADIVGDLEHAVQLVPLMPFLLRRQQDESRKPTCAEDVTALHERSDRHGLKPFLQDRQT